MGEPTLSVDYMDLVRVVARQMGYGSTYSTGTVQAFDKDDATRANEIEINSGVWPSWAGNAAINMGGVVYGISSRKSDTVLVADPIAADIAASTDYVLVQSITDDKADTFRDIQDVIDQAYQELCFPLPSDESYFIWSWLLERADISFVHNTEAYDCEDDFGQFIESSITYKEGLDHPAVTLISQKEYRGEQARDSTGGVPRYLMWRQKAFAAATGRRFEVVLYPTPVAPAFPESQTESATEFTEDGKHLEYMYRVIPEKLTPTDRYPLCGAIHGDTLMKACQAVAERKLGDDAGIYEAKFKERLAASMAIDRAVKATMGI